MFRSYPSFGGLAIVAAYGWQMDLHCPAVVLCLLPGEPEPSTVAGHRVVAAYVYGEARPSERGSFPLSEAPAGKFWEVITDIADIHRGEAVILYADLEELGPRDLRGIALSIDSGGPVRIPDRSPVDNGY